MRKSAIVLLLLLSACDTCITPASHTKCPPLKLYSAQSNIAFAATYETLPEDAKSRIDDYRLLRQECGQQ